MFDVKGKDLLFKFIQQYPREDWDRPFPAKGAILISNSFKFSYSNNMLGSLASRALGDETLPFFLLSILVCKIDICRKRWTAFVDCFYSVDYLWIWCQKVIFRWRKGVFWSIKSKMCETWWKKMKIIRFSLVWLIDSHITIKVIVIVSITNLRCSD